MLNSGTIWTTFGIYLAFLLVVAITVTVKERKKKDHSSMHQASVPAPVLIMTYLSSLMSTWVFFAGPGAYYRMGMGYWLSEMSYIILFPLISFFTMNKVWLINKERNLTTPADFFYERWPSKGLRVVYGLIFLASSFPYIASVIVAIARAADIASGGKMNYATVCIAVGLMMTIFVAVGGVKSAATVDTVQGLLFIIALWVIAISALRVGFGGSFSSAVEQVKNSTPEFFSYPGPNGGATYAMRFGYPFSCAIGWTIMLPHVFVRSGYFGDNQKTQRKLYYMTPILQGIVWTGTFVIGLIGVSLAPKLPSENTELIIPYIVETFIAPNKNGLAVALMLIFLVGATAVGLSTANAFLTVSASIVESDFIKNTFGIKISEKNQTMVSRIIIFVLGLASTLLALNPPELIFTLIMFSIAIVMPLFPILVFALYWKRATKMGAITGAIAGTIVVLLTYFSWGIGDTWYGAFGMIASTVVCVVVSLLTKDDEAGGEKFYTALAKSERRFYKKPKHAETEN